MEHVAVSKRNRTKENKENAQPVPGSKPLIRGAKTTAPFQVKNNKEMLAVPKRAATTVPKHSRPVLTQQTVKLAAPSQVKSSKREETTTKAAPLRVQAKQVDLRSAAVLKKVQTVQRDGRGAAATSQARWQRTHSQASLSEKNTSDKALNPHALPPLPKSALGVYKGKVVQSKIGSIWKQSATAPRQDSKQPAPKRDIQKSVSATAPRDKVVKPVASSTVRQYRFKVETEEEKREKLAKWMASKGKTFKRPAMTMTAPSRSKVSAKPGANLKARSQAAEWRNPKPLPSVEADRLLPAAPAAPAPPPCADTQGAESQTPMIRNTSIDLLENSDADLSADPDGSIHDVVLNLCDALEAMATPSKCDDDALPQETGVCIDGDEEVQVEVECNKEELKSEVTEDVGQVKLEQVKADTNDGDEQDVEIEEEDEDQDEDSLETTPQVENASVVKYNVKTTPYLQSVKKTLEDEAGMSASRRKSNIKDLRFLTPVRRSCRIQRNSSVLPSMLLDHDPCVSSLAELVKLDDDSNAYIYRKNDALLKDLPDQPSL